MSLLVHSSTSTSVGSFQTGAELAGNVISHFGKEALSGIIAYATVSHDAAAFLNGIREAVGPEVPVIGCSSQGIMTRGAVTEEGYAAGVMGFGGTSLQLVSAKVEEFQVDSENKVRVTGHRDQPLRGIAISRYGASRSAVTGHRDQF